MSTSPTLHAIENPTPPAKHTFWLIASLILVAYSTYAVWTEQGSFEMQLLALGIALGVCLYNASFGFTSAWRQLIGERRGAGVRAQLLMLGISVILFFPALANGELLGQPVAGFVRPLGWSVIFGAFIFGVGMQIANGCASGNLYHTGGGQLRAIPAMLGFSGGALWATLDFEWWTTLPQLAPIGLIELFGPVAAIAANIAVFVAIYVLTLRIEKRAHGSIATEAKPMNIPFYQRFVRGQWPMLWGAIGLALLNFITLAMLGRPWAVALAYPVWGAKAADYFGINLELDFAVYWMNPAREAALYEPLTSDPASLMNVGVILGAFLAATLAKRFNIEWKLPPLQFIGALFGGVMLGYGATIAYGCNIGAFIGGVVSGSLHGWLWIVCAFAGSIVGTKLRPLFRLK